MVLCEILFYSNKILVVLYLHDNLWRLAFKVLQRPLDVALAEEFNRLFHFDV